MKKGLMLLGSTGSIGRQVLEIIRKDEDFKVLLLSAKNNITLLKDQIEEFLPEYVYVQDKDSAVKLKNALTGSSCKVFFDTELLFDLLRNNDYYMAINAIVGMQGIRATMAVIESGHDIGIANKETLVCAGHILMPLSKKTGSSIFAIDSEHSAIVQSFIGEKKENIDHIIITASGGPFFEKNRNELEKVTINDALKHPNWSMGRKISIDSATMVNKALEVMEAKWLFDIDIDRIKVVVHRQSIIHSAVCYNDGAIKAQMGVTSMLLPISYALYKYDRKVDLEKLDLIKIARLDFAEVKKDIFDGFYLGIEAAKIGGSMPTIFNAANEMAVNKFLNKEIGFLDIPRIIKNHMDKHSVIENPSIEDILNIEEKFLV